MRLKLCIFHSSFLPVHDTSSKELFSLLVSYLQHKFSAMREISSTGFLPAYISHLQQNYSRCALDALHRTFLTIAGICKCTMKSLMMLAFKGAECIANREIIFFLYIQNNHMHKSPGKGIYCSKSNKSRGKDLLEMGIFGSKLPYDLPLVEGVLPRKFHYIYSYHVQMHNGQTNKRSSL